MELGPPRLASPEVCQLLPSNINTTATLNSADTVSRQNMTSVSMNIHGNLTLGMSFFEGLRKLLSGLRRPQAGSDPPKKTVKYLVLSCEIRSLLTFFRN